MVIKINIPWSSSIIRNETLVSFWSLVLGVSGEHGLQGHAYAFYVLDGRPALCSEEVEADYAVGIDVWVHGNGAGRVGGEGECYFRWFCVEG
jgi:hypothetical protein